MTDETPVKEPAKILDGRGVSYELKGEKCDIACFALDDGGFSWEFKRADRVYPLRLSKIGMEVMISLYHEMLWSSPPVGKSE